MKTPFILHKTLVPILVLLLLSGSLVNGQSRKEAPVEAGFRLKARLKQSPPEAMLDLFVKGDVDKIKRYVRDKEAFFKGSVDGIASIRLQASFVEGLLRSEYVKWVDPGRRVVPLNDTMRVQNHIEAIHRNETPLPESYNGRDVVVGVIDQQLEWEHGDFKDSLGNTRVKYLWDQTAADTATNTPPQYGYGRVWDASDMDTGGTTHDPGIGKRHGTNVTGTAAGNGLATGNHKGAAPASDIVFVSTDGRSTSIADGVDFIFQKAKALGKPCVINVSYGSYVGSHDGKDAAARFIDSLVNARKGRMVVVAAGNGGDQEPFHLRTELSETTNDTAFTWFKYNPNSILGYGAVFYEVWADKEDLQDVEYAVGADRVQGNAAEFRGRTAFLNISDHLGTQLTRAIQNPQGDTLGVVDFFAEQRGDRYLLQVRLKEPDSSSYNFRFMSTGSGKFDVWSSDWADIRYSHMVYQGLPSQSELPDISNYVRPDLRQSMVSSWACSPEVLTVGNYQGRVRHVDVNGDLYKESGATRDDIAASSSSGPTRTGSIKPDLVATGDYVLTAGPIESLDWHINNEPFKVARDSLHMKQGGTSTASPVVAGIAALYMDRCPDASHQEIMKALRSAADVDQFTGNVPNITWGFGKVNASLALNSSYFSPTITGQGTDWICEGDSKPLRTDGAYERYQWSTGDQTREISIAEGGEYWVRVTDSSGCPAYSDTIEVEERPAPEPTIEQVGDSIVCPGDSTVLEAQKGFGEYRWSHGKSGRKTYSDGGGAYAVTVTDAAGCEGTTDTVRLDEYPEPPAPSIQRREDTLFSSSAPAYQWYRDGEAVDGATGPFLVLEEGGAYHVTITDTNGCKARSDTVLYYPTRVAAPSKKEGWSIRPNPSQGWFKLRTTGSLPAKSPFRLYDMLGKRVKVPEHRITRESKQVLRLDLSFIPDGKYYITVPSKEGPRTLKLIKQ